MFLADSATLLLTGGSVTRNAGVLFKPKRPRPDGSVVMWCLPTCARSIVFAALQCSC